jgi:hypothetical protein
MFRSIVIGLTLLAGATAPLAAQPDRAYTLIGTWSCTSSESTGTITYLRDADGSISMKNVFALTNATWARGEFDEQYRFDPATAVWTWTAEQPQLAAFQERGTAGPWTTQSWIFDGTLRVAGSRTLDSIAAPTQTTTQAVRMVYTSLGDNAFRRDFEFYQKGLWAIRSSGTCKRVPTGGGHA